MDFKDRPFRLQTLPGLEKLALADWSIRLLPGCFKIRIISKLEQRHHLHKTSVRQSRSD